MKLKQIFVKEASLQAGFSVVSNKLIKVKSPPLRDNEDDVLALRQDEDRLTLETAKSGED